MAAVGEESGVAAGIEQSPTDDVGADTLSRFRYQAELAAQYAMDMLAGGPVSRIYCELHEDYVVVLSDERPPLLVSVKHLDVDQPRWTLQGLCNDGGVAHLYRRWVETGRVATCLLQTNSGLRGGTDNTAELALACSGADPRALDKWAEALTPLIGAESVADCRAFLLGLRIEDRLPDRRHLRATNLIEHVPQCLQSLGLSQGLAERTYDAIVQAVERASRNEIQGGARLAMSDPDRLEVSGQVRELLLSKMITIDSLRAAVDPHDTLGGVSMAVLVDAAPASSQRLTAKLEQGGVGPTGVNNARSLRLNWIGHRDRWTPDLPDANDPFDDVAARVLDAAHAAETATRVPAEQYATAMEAALIERLGNSEIGVPGDPGTDPRLLLGCAYELTNQCHIFWSDQFSVPDE